MHPLAHSSQSLQIFAADTSSHLKIFSEKAARKKGIKQPIQHIQKQQMLTKKL